MPILSRVFTVSLVLACALPAAADAKVVVELRGSDGKPTDGTVELTKGDQKHSCTTREARCEISGVAGGMYTAEVKQPGKASPKPKQVMIPPSGEVKLIINAS